jgi:hypothetical protein
MIEPPAVLMTVAIGDDVRMTIQKVPIVNKNSIRNNIADSKMYGKMRLIMCDTIGSSNDCNRAWLSGLRNALSILSPI